MKLLGLDSKKIGARTAAVLLMVIGFVVGLVVAVAIGPLIVIAILLGIVIAFQVGTMLLVESLFGGRKKEGKSVRSRSGKTSGFDRDELEEL